MRLKDDKLNECSSRTFSERSNCSLEEAGKLKIYKNANIVLPKSLGNKNESTCKRLHLNQPEILQGNPGTGRSWTKGNFAKVEYFRKSEWEPFEALLRFWGIVIHSPMETSEWQKKSWGFHKIAEEVSRNPASSWYLCTYLFICLLAKRALKLKL